MLFLTLLLTISQVASTQMAKEFRVICHQMQNTGQNITIFMDQVPLDSLLIDD